MAFSGLLQSFSNNYDAVLLKQECYKSVETRLHIVTILKYHGGIRLVRTTNYNKSQNISKVIESR